MKRLKFTLHFSFIIFLAVSIILGQGILFTEYFLCLVLHEMVHGYFARRLGYEIGKIKLMATGAVLEAESDEFTYRDEIIIAISGPLFNLCFALLLLAMWWVFPSSYNWTQDLCIINLSIFVFNLLPIFPLDGGRVLLAMMSKRTDRKTAVKICRWITLILSILMFLIFIFSFLAEPNFSIGVMAITLFISGISEDKMAFYKRSLYLVRKGKRTKKRGLEVRYVMIHKDTDPAKLLRLLNAKFYTIFLLVDDNLNVVSHIPESNLLGRDFVETP